MASIESQPHARKKKALVHAQTVTRAKSQLMAITNGTPTKGISVAILLPSDIVFEATARVAPEKQTESLPADALFHDS